MKKNYLLLLMLAFTFFTNAQVIEGVKIEVPEPEFEQDAILLTSNTEGIPLPIEHSKLKSTEHVGLALIGVGKVNNYFQLEGPASEVTLDTTAYYHDLYIIISWQDNKRSPHRLFQIVPLEIQKNRRIYNVSKANNFTGVAEENRGYIKFTAEKYGDHSYLIKIPVSEIQKPRDPNNRSELRDYGKQFVIRLLDASTEKLSDTEDYITFGIEKYDRRKRNKNNH